MGKISNIKAISDTKISITLEIGLDELHFLKGKLENMHLFSEENLEHESRLIQRGSKDSTKYLLIPKSLRGDILPNSSVLCSSIETLDKNIFIFSVPKISSILTKTAPKTYNLEVKSILNEDFR